MAYNQFAYSYLATGDYEKSLLAINKYIEIAPDEANPYDTRGDIYAAAGRLDDATSSYQKVLAVEPDFGHSLMQLGFMYLFRLEYTSADSCFHAFIELADSPGGRSAGRLYLTYVSAHQGRFDEALRLLDDYLAADSLESNLRHTADNQAQKRFLKALIYRERGDYDRVLAQTNRTLELYRTNRPDDRWGYQYMYAQFLAEAGRYESAECAAAEMKAYIESLGDSTVPDYWYADG